MAGSPMRAGGSTSRRWAAARWPGAGFPVDREFVASELGFTGVTANSIDATGDRDFVVELLAAAALAMTHLSRLAEELVWWSNPAFGYVRLSDAFSTGSSMMPNKRNPDPAELVRGRAAGVIGQLTGALALLKGIPAGYQRDLQEDKRPLFEALATLEQSLGVMAGVVDGLTFDRARLRDAAARGSITATAMADALTEAGAPFRAAHLVVGGLVANAEERGVGLDELGEEAIAEAMAQSDDHTTRGLASDSTVPRRMLAATGLNAALSRFDVTGGTAPARVRAALSAAEARLGIPAAESSGGDTGG